MASIPVAVPPGRSGRGAHAPAVPTSTAQRREAILLAAERLFAERGYHAVSIRDIATAAGVPLALVGYHFGAKHELFVAIFDRWRATIDERLAALNRVRLDPADPATLPAIVDAFVAPVLRLRASAEGESYALLVARQLYEPLDEVDPIMRGHFDPLAHAFIDALQAALPWAERSQVAWGYQFALGALLLHLSDDRVERLSRGANTRASPAAAPLLKAFIVGGLRQALPAPEPAAVSAPPGAARRSRPTRTHATRRPTP